MQRILFKVNSLALHCTDEGRPRQPGVLIANLRLRTSLISQEPHIDTDMGTGKARNPKLKHISYYLKNANDLEINTFKPKFATKVESYQQ